MKAVFFDLDNTLYSAACNLFGLIDVRINRYMHEVVGIPAESVDALRCHYWRQYGVTLRGLMEEHGTDPEDYLHYVHDIDVTSRLRPDPQLRRQLDAMPQRKFVFTNGTAEHAERVLGCLGVRDCFEELFDIRVSDYCPKPQLPPYQAVLRRTQVAATEALMVEDSADNLTPAGRLGMRTILVASHARRPPQADAVVASVHQVPALVAHWQRQLA